MDNYTIDYYIESLNSNNNEILHLEFREGLIQQLVTFKGLQSRLVKQKDDFDQSLNLIKDYQRNQEEFYQERRQLFLDRHQLCQDNQNLKRMVDQFTLEKQSMMDQVAELKEERSKLTKSVQSKDNELVSQILVKFNQKLHNDKENIRVTSQLIEMQHKLEQQQQQSDQRANLQDQQQKESFSKLVQSLESKRNQLEEMVEEINKTKVHLEIDLKINQQKYNDLKQQFSKFQNIGQLLFKFIKTPAGRTSFYGYCQSTVPQRDMKQYTPFLDQNDQLYKKSDIKIGSIVLVHDLIAHGSGIVRFIGKVSFEKGIWVGVELDTAAGKNDGAVQGKRYFTCTKKHGVFAKYDKVSLLSEPSNFSKVSSSLQICY
ncbi:hypothetical protein DFA_02033 [Cavenderia fasciculata]|uniref:CAP-Gly domain-containing protein n=1 Tax=Cavenderia fasciculata TaxID=261658 RepID=F4PYI1_CACFS|nr:uncharacterized protein DFA_02033 [Cavenderia fasciculata]EGG19247.1 hypothetical protein DFA_02033 [Cavenderia fasciculata]|eukprot:XP_004357518.1 hypothetical protein DFA_02033 [Cavenderia fasciculata]